ncbi:hypothetical protein Q2K19_04960 [Micromonospora soli]|uniref:hypothetical protein n=1 Tax=Micromonospora sp. NBRC 110009 TaxID=3061627 RepID=UPI0026737076|nr:hypothetical protein [Micromonospora sp. NBRC 110009]WKT99844.1 hypothetical protein Q2K19_04960 [Micromonospora sp. NBRC 110009]
MGNSTFFQSGSVQNADKIYNFGDNSDPMAAGRRLLDERAYRQAAQCFERFLAQGASQQSSKRAEANVLVAIAMLARHPPSYRTPEQATKIVHHLMAAETSLAAVVAGLVRDDYYLSVGISDPSDLATLASTAEPANLTLDELNLIERHLAAVPGRTWERLRAHCRSLGIHLPAAAAGPPSAMTTTARLIGVSKYFVTLPPAPPPDRGGLAATLVGLGLGLALLPCGGLYVETRWYVGLALLILLPAVGVVVGLVGIGLWRDSQQDRKARQRYEEARAAAAGGPSDKQMDTWLEQDVMARGARRLRLNPALVAGSGDLLVEPQAAVGVSRLESDQTVEQVVAQGNSTRIRVVRKRTTLGKTRVGKDGKLRSDHYEVLVLYLSAHRASVFKCDLDLATRQLLTEETVTFHYRDVVSISSRTIVLPKSAEGAIPILDAVSGRNMRHFADSRFTLSLVNGQHLEVSVALNTDNRELEVAWANSDVHQVVERMVWSRKEQEEGSSS